MDCGCQFSPYFWIFKPQQCLQSTVKSDKFLSQYASSSFLTIWRLTSHPTAQFYNLLPHASAYGIFSSIDISDTNVVQYNVVQLTLLPKNRTYCIICHENLAQMTPNYWRQCGSRIFKRQKVVYEDLNSNPTAELQNLLPYVWIDTKILKPMWQ